ncbi:MAG: 30S ribosomal protein S4 [Bacillota bacterium]
MGRHTDAVCRLCRREKDKLYLKGDRCFSDKCAVVRHAYPPGEHGQARQKFSEFGQQLREKQKARRLYGVREKQFRRYFKEADRRRGVTGEILLQLLESRLDNVIFRLGLARSRSEARQLITHGHYEVNGRKVDIPSYLVKAGDVVAVRENRKNKPVFTKIAEAREQQGTPEWLEVDHEKLQGRILRVPQRDEIDAPLTEHFIVELYSR